MGLKHADQIQGELRSNKNKQQLEYFQRAEEALFSDIETAQSKGETRCETMDELSQSTIDKLKALDYVVKQDDYSYTVYWGADRHKKKGFFSW